MHKWFDMVDFLNIFLTWEKSEDSHDISLKACDLCGKYLWKTWNLEMHKRETQWLFRRLTNDKCDCLLTGRPFEETFKNAQWRKVKQMQSMWLCILICRPFGDTFENAQRGKAKQMQPVQLCILSQDSCVTGNMRRRLKTHSRDKSNKCNQCDCACHDVSNLKRRVKAHRGQRSNKCKQCDFASPQAGHLRTHLANHSREKQDKCNRCDYACYDASNLRRHVKAHRRGSGKVQQMQTVWLCILSGRQFEESFENPQWRKTKQMQPVWLCRLWCFQFEETYESPQEIKV